MARAATPSPLFCCLTRRSTRTSRMRGFASAAGRRLAKFVRPRTPMPYQYGEIFERLGIPGMGRIGATWCALNSKGVLVLMAHQNYVHKRRGIWKYEMRREGPMLPRGPSATRSLNMIGSYFAKNKQIILPIAVFVTDGGPRSDGTWEPSEFKYATGDVYDARMQEFDPVRCYLLCDIERRYSV